MHVRVATWVGSVPSTPSITLRRTVPLVGYTCSQFLDSRCFDGYPCGRMAALRMRALYMYTSSSIVISLQPTSSAAFTLPATVVRAIRGKLCGRELLIKTLHWGLQDSTARRRYNDSTPLLGNLTTLELFARCNGQIQMVRALVGIREVRWTTREVM